MIIDNWTVDRVQVRYNKDGRAIGIGFDLVAPPKQVLMVDAKTEQFGLAD